MFVFKDSDTKDDPVYKFGDDDDDDELLRQVLPDPVTKPHTSPSCEDSTETVNPVQGPACATQTGPTSRVTTNARHDLPLAAMTNSTTTQALTPGQSEPLDTDPTFIQASQLLQQPHGSTDQSPGLNGHIPGRD